MQILNLGKRELAGVNEESISGDTLSEGIGRDTVVLLHPTSFSQ